MRENLDDIAGVRVICSFIDDIYDVSRMLARQDDIRVIAIKDYIRSPKVNGYRSYHMILEIPVFFSNCKQYIRAEVQIRTIAMDFWASLDHQLKYKKVWLTIPKIQLMFRLHTWTRPTSQVHSQPVSTKSFHMNSSPVTVC